MISLGYATVRATRITYVGELGWELYVPAEFAVGVYEDLMAAGEHFGVARGGYYAIESLRLEKGYRAFGRELTPNDNPVEAGLLFACKLETDIDFLGRAAVETAKAEGRGASWSASSCRLARADAVGRRADPARRVAARPGDVGRVGRDDRGVRRTGLRARRRRRSTRDWIAPARYEVNVGGDAVSDHRVAQGRSTTRQASGSGAADWWQRARPIPSFSVVGEEVFGVVVVVDATG